MVVLSSMKHRGLQKVFSLGNQQGSYDYSSECFLVVEKHCFHLPAPSSGVPQVFQEINLFVVEKLEDIFLWPNYQSTLPKYSIVVSPKKEGRGGLLIEKITVAGKNLLWVQIPPLHGNFTDKRRSLDYVYISTKKIRFGRAFVYAD